jgi:hypothetical protein
MPMLTFVRSRVEAHRLVRYLNDSLMTEGDDWKIAVDEQGRPVIITGSFRVMLAPRAVRLFDAVHLFCDDVEIWLPLLARLRLRSVARYFLIRFAAREVLPSPDQRKAAGAKN